MSEKIVVPKGHMLCPVCNGRRRMGDGSACEYCDLVGTVKRVQRWICTACGAVHHYKAAECQKCDSVEIKEMSQDFQGIGEGDIGWTARRLARLCDIYGMSAEQVVERTELLKEAGIYEERLTDDIIREANRLDRELMAAIRARIARVNAMQVRLHPGTSQRDEPAAPSAQGGGGDKRSKLFGYPITAVIRWMGQHEWEFKDAQFALEKLEIDVAPSTIRIQLRAGLVGDKSRGEPAALTPAQVKELME